MLLETLNLPKELKTLNRLQLQELCAELRTVLLEQVSKTGGHLASNLGVVELTVMLHRVFDTPEDQIIWDVGHQAYVHKLLTGRFEQFGTLRQKGGLSGFPKTDESIYDSFNTGHSSTSVSAGLGMAAARDLNRENYRVVSVIGDGSLTGGLAFEAINHAGQAKRDLLVILNDNEMSIRENVGALSVYLNRFRSRGFYYRFKQVTERGLTAIPGIGKPLYRALDYTKSSVKRLFSIGTLFESFGFRYVGPIDGHNLNDLETTLQRCKNMRGPVLLHVKTVKGKGYVPAEQTPNSFHGVGPFDLSSDALPKKSRADYAKTVGDTLCALAERNENLVAVSAAMIDGTGLDRFARTYPDRIFDVGIAEAHAVTFSAGLARKGKVPVFAVYSSFLQRAYDQIIHDVCMQNLHVVFAIDHAGMVGADGETHQGLLDVSYLKSAPNLTFLAASSTEELSEMLRYAVEDCDGPVAVRYEKEGFLNTAATAVGCCTEAQWLRSGGDAVIISYGRLVHEAVKAADELDARGISCGVLNLRSLKPLDTAAIYKAAEARDIFVFEECQTLGGIGETVAALLSDHQPSVRVFTHGVADRFIGQGMVSEQLNDAEISAEHMMKRILEVKK